MQFNLNGLQGYTDCKSAWLTVISSSKFYLLQFSQLHIKCFGLHILIIYQIISIEIIISHTSSLMNCFTLAAGIKSLQVVVGLKICHKGFIVGSRSELHGLLTPFRIKQSKNRWKEKIEVFHIMFILLLSYSKK